jgi:50S ribosomal protein L16 3-hydroxylase
LIRFEQFDPDTFLRDYWQRKPLLMRAALPDFQDPISAEELAGLALEEDIDARIVETRPDGWGFREGPFGEGDFDSAYPWTLLVQKVDHYLDNIAVLRQLVSFLPGWRFDDVMISYASPGAGVGPHYDNYDVFLVQGSGQRTWRLGQWCEEDEPLIDHADLHILERFEDSAEYILEAGDVLYVPPRLAHWGTAESDSLTYSLGFRAPRLNDMVSRGVDAGLEAMNPERLYRDPPLQTQRPGEITPQALDAARQSVLNELKAITDSSSWFGELVTDGAEQLPQLAVSEGQTLRLDCAARLAWRELPDTLEIYANGESLLANLDQLPGIQALCSGESICAGQDLNLALARQLGEGGCLRDEEVFAR